MTYTTLLFDLDHTLLDSDESEALAYAATMRRAGVANPEQHFDRYRQINRALWAEVERGEIGPNQVRSTRFDQFGDEIGVDFGPDAADWYVQELGANGDLYPGARQILDDVSRRAKIALVTNGIGEVQRARVERLALARYFDAIVISGEVGTAKPGTEIFDIAFDQLGNPDKATSVMIGDSLSSDIRGGSNYEIDTCWYNPHGATAGRDDQITHEIADLSEVTYL